MLACVAISLLQQPVIVKRAAVTPEIATVGCAYLATHEFEDEPVPETPVPWSEEDTMALARTISGESYEDKPHDKRKVAEVVLNRLSDGRWGCTVLEVVTAKSQFRGYWKPGREISENDMDVAVQALRDWYANGCESLSEYLYFSRGRNRENMFRKTY